MRLHQQERHATARAGYHPLTQQAVKAVFTKAKAT